MNLVEFEQKLASLREMPGILKGEPSRKAFEFSRLRGGIPRGAVTEVSGAAGGGKTELLLAFLAEHPDLRAAWIEDQFTVYPCALPQQGVQLDRILFVEGKEESLWATHQALRSQLFGIVVLSTRIRGRTDLRRLQLSAEQANASVILLTESPTVQGAWPISLQLRISRKDQKWIAVAV